MKYYINISPHKKAELKVSLDYSRAEMTTEGNGMG